MGMITNETVALIEAQNGLDIDTYGSRLELVMAVMDNAGIGSRHGTYGDKEHLEALDRIEKHLGEVRKKIARENASAEDWEKWWTELQRLATAANWPCSEDEPWRDYYSDGYTPKDALEEEMSYGK